MKPTVIFLFAIILTACSERTETLFSRIDPNRTGIGFKNLLVEDSVANVMNYTYFYNGGGVAVGDINNDGLQDILFTGNMVPNRLYLNKGDFRFEDVTETTGISKAQGWCTGATFADVNNDGLTDIYICRSADVIAARRRNLLFINHGNLSFTEEAEKFGLADQGYSSQTAFFDYDKDGDLDMFLINHSLQQYANEGLENPTLRNQQQPAFANKLYQNNKGVFTDVSSVAGITSNVLTFGLGVAISDFNNDGWPDVYVSNDFNEPDYLFVNSQDGRFTEQLANCMDEVSLFSMGSDAADYNNDGLVDLYTLDMLPDDNYGQKMHNGAENFDKYQMLYRNGFYYQSSRNMLHRNNGDGTFSEIGQMAGVSATDWSWAALFCDYDNDGLKDLLVTNGYVKDYTNMDFMRYSADRAVMERRGQKNESIIEYIARMPSIVKQNCLFRNAGDYSFRRSNDRWGLPEENVSAGAAYVDLDNDGDMDIVINNTNEPAGIYRNNGTGNHFLKVAGIGIGSKVKLFCGSDIYYQEQYPVRGFQSSVDPVLNFGIGKHEVVDSVVIIWSDDTMQKYYGVPHGSTLLVKKSGTPFQKDQSGLNPVFVRDSALGYRSAENEFNDFTVQPLLPGYLSRSGPCIAKADMNGDGLDDLYIGGAKDIAGAVFVQTRMGTFARSLQSAIDNDAAAEDTDAVFFDADNDGDMDLYVTSGGYEFREPDPALEDRFYINDGKGKFSRRKLPGRPTSNSCVKPCDIDLDGDMDLFVGGRLVPGRYPEPASSYVLLNDGKGNYTDRTSSIAPLLKSIGMVTDAAWVDVNGDKLKDLIIVGEWMPVMVLENTGGGRLQDVSAKYIQFPSTGWWNAIAAADMDGDGDEDLVIGNNGLNSQFQCDAKWPVSMVYSDFDGNGSIDPVLSYYIDGVSYPMASRDDFTDQLPALKKKYLAYESYARATVADIFPADQLKKAASLRVDCMATVLLMNNGNKGFVNSDLPAEAQLSPVHAITLGDFDADGSKDILLAGNNSWCRVKFGKYRAGHGIMLRGEDGGKFSYVPQYESGLKVRGNARSMEIIQAGDKRLLVIGMNDDYLQCYGLNK